MGGNKHFVEELKKSIVLTGENKIDVDVVNRLLDFCNDAKSVLKDIHKKQLSLMMIIDEKKYKLEDAGDQSYKPQYWADYAIFYVKKVNCEDFKTWVAVDRDGVFIFTDIDAVRDADGWTKNPCDRYFYKRLENANGERIKLDVFDEKIQIDITNILDEIRT